MASTFRPELVPTWAKVTAWAVPLTVLPSLTWRLISSIDGLVSDNECFGPSTPLGEKVYVIALLPLVHLGTALLTIGLIRPWGEVLPRWIPVLGGRRVPLGFAVGAATTGAILVLAVIVLGQFGDVMDDLWAALGRDRPLGARPLPAGCERPGWDILRWYLPMLLWPPLLLAVTWHYLRRRRASVREMMVAGAAD